jgi:hypothetical protein
VRFLFKPKADMATFYDTLLNYCETNDKVIIDWPNRAMLGMTVSRAFKEKNPNIRLPKVRTTEPEGYIWAVQYPDNFSVEMEELIKNHYLNIPKKKRKRIPVKQKKPIYSVR